MPLRTSLYVDASGSRTGAPNRPSSISSPSSFLPSSEVSNGISIWKFVIGFRFCSRGIPPSISNNMNPSEMQIHHSLFVV